MSVPQTYSVSRGGFVLEHEGNDLITLLVYAIVRRLCIVLFLENVVILRPAK